MSCDGSAGEALVLGDDWRWVYRSEDDVSDWSAPIVTLLNSAGVVVASSSAIPAPPPAEGEEPGEDVEPVIILTGGFEGQIPATDFDAGVFTWWISEEFTTGLSSQSYTLNVSVLIGGVASTVLREVLVPVRGVPR